MVWRIPRGDFYLLDMKFIFLKDNHHKNPKEKELMSDKPYASAVGGLMYATLCTERDIFYAVGIIS